MAFFFTSGTRLLHSIELTGFASEIPPSNGKCHRTFRRQRPIDSISLGFGTEPIVTELYNRRK